MQKLHGKRNLRLFYVVVIRSAFLLSVFKTRMSLDLVQIPECKVEHVQVDSLVGILFNCAACLKGL